MRKQVEFIEKQNAQKDQKRYSIGLSLIKIRMGGRKKIMGKRILVVQEGFKIGSSPAMPFHSVIDSLLSV
jgi:hypothetical protein